MYIPFYIIILIFLYTCFWIGGYFITLFQVGNEQISKKIALLRMKIFATMGIIELVAFFYFLYL